MTMVTFLVANGLGKSRHQIKDSCPLVLREAFRFIIFRICWKEIRDEDNIYVCIIK